MRRPTATVLRNSGIISQIPGVQSLEIFSNSFEKIVTAQMACELQPLPCFIPFRSLDCSPGETPLSVKMDVKALIVDPIANMPVVILRDEEEKNFLPIWVGVFEANAIALQMEGVTTPRPMTHDLLKNLILQIEGDVHRVVINSLEENTFYAQIHLRVANKDVLVDSRPSDAIALALRTPGARFRGGVGPRNEPKREDTCRSQSAERLRKWLEEADPDTLGKYRM